MSWHCPGVCGSGDMCLLCLLVTLEGSAVLVVVEYFKGSPAASKVIEFSLLLRAFGSAWEFVCCNLGRLGEHVPNCFDIVDGCDKYLSFDCLVSGL